MAFSILSEFIRDFGEKYLPAPKEGENAVATRSAVLRKVTPTRSLFDTKNPMPWVDSASTDITRHWRKEQ